MIGIAKDAFREGTKIVREGRKTYRDIRHAVRRKTTGKTTRRASSVRKTATMMRGTGSDTEVKRVDIIQSAGVNLVACDGSRSGNQNFQTGFVATNLMQQGTGDFNRVANKVKVLQTVIDAELVRVTNDSSVRMMCVFDSSPDKAYPALNEIIKDYDQTGVAYTQFLSHNNVHNTDRFRILRNKVILLNETEPTKHVKIVLKNPYSCQYDGTASPTAITSVLKGTIYWIFFYSGATAPQIQNISIRCTFTDK